MTTVGLYLRLSLIKMRGKDGKEVADVVGLIRQQQAAERLAADRGWTGIVYEDKASAYKRNVVRKEWERLLKDLATGNLDGVVVYDIDRLARQPRDLERLIDLYEANPKLVFGTCQGNIDISTADGRFVARVMVGVANKSSADTARRVAAAHRYNAEQGIPVGGSRPFGWASDKKTVDPIEASYIRQAVKDVLAGKGVHTITKEWNKAGLKTPRGNLWCKQVVRKLLMYPRVAGFRVHQGQIALDPSGSPVKGLWEPILSVEQWEAVKAVLTDPARSGRHVHMGGRKYLLSGIVRCAVCKSVLRGNADRQYNTFLYVCQAPMCGKVGITGPRTDEVITKLVLARLAEREVERPAEAPWEGSDELRAVTQRIADLMEAFTSGRLSGNIAFAMLPELERRQAELRSDKNLWLRTRAPLAPTDAATEWPNLSVEQQREVVQAVLPMILIHPAAHRGGAFDPGRIEVWKPPAPTSPDPVEAQR